MNSAHSLARASLFVLWLACGMSSTQPARAQVLQPASGAGVFGNPYAFLGLNGSHSWEVYRKMNGNAVVTGSTDPTNGTLAEFTNQHLGDAPGAGYNFTGELLLSTSQAATPSSGMIYLKDMTLNNGASASPSQNYDANLHGAFDLRIGFVQSGSAYMTAKGGDNHDTDLFGENRGTNGVYVHLGGGNVGATVAGQPGTAWNVGINGGGYLFNSSSAAENLLTPTSVSRTLITSGGAPTDNGTLYSSPLELGAKLIADPNAQGNVLFQAKAGNNLYQFSFNPSDPSFNGTFDWQHSTPILFIGKGAFDSFNPSVAHVGILAPGDADADGAVNFADLVAVAQNYGSSNDPTWSTGDFNGDGTVGFADLVTVAQHYGQSFNAGPAAASDVPEPSAPMILGFAACLFAILRPRRPTFAPITPASRL